MSLARHVFLVTGASGNVGRRVVERLLEEGALVVAVDRVARESAAERLWSVVADLADEASVEKAFDQAEKSAGPLWGVLHIAGGWQGGALVRDTDMKLFDQMMSMNLRTSFLVGRAALRRLSPRGGRIVFMGSYSAATLTNTAGSGAYNVSKAAVIALARVMAEEGREAGVLVNAVAPNTIATGANRAAMPRADSARWVPIDAVANALLSLASPDSAISGSVVVLPGR